MLDIDTKRRIDTARDILVGKVPDPKSQVEQITIALIYKFMDDMDAESEEFGGKRNFFAGEYARYGWVKLMRSGLGGFETLNLYAEAIAKMPENPGVPPLFRDIFKNAYLPYRDPETLKMFLKVIDEFTYDHSEKLGDAFEYLLSVLGSQGDAGQFRTPRHIIDFMVEIIDPKKTETVLDPACGTAGFLISAYKHILKANTSNPTPTGRAAGVRDGDLLTPDDKGRLARNFTGYDISPDMVRLSLVNMYLHGFADPHIYEYDTLTSQDRWNENADVILANPPFMSPKGGITPHNRFSVQSKRSEVLFVDYMAEHLTPNGRAAIIVPEGVIFQSQTAYKQLRKLLVEQYLVAVISLPAGVFNPYSGVKTSILILDKSLAKKTDAIAFFKVEHDGFSLGAQRREIDKNDLPAAAAFLKTWFTSPKSNPSAATPQMPAFSPTSDPSNQSNPSAATSRLPATPTTSDPTNPSATTSRIPAPPSTPDPTNPSAATSQLPATHATPDPTDPSNPSAHPTPNALIVAKTKIVANGEYNLSGERYREGAASNHSFPLISLGEESLFHVESGGTPKSDVDEYWDGGIPWATLVDLPATDFISQITSTKRTISERGLRESSAKLIPANSVIVSTRATIGRIAINRIPIATNQGFKNIVIEDPSRVLPEYVALALTKLVPTMDAWATGGTFKEISKSKFCELQIPLPPLAVQQEIVTEIEGYQKVINGARAVLDNYRPHIPIHPDWPMVELGEVCERMQYGLSVSLNTDGVGYKTFRMNELVEGRCVDRGDMKCADISKDELEKYRLSRGEILFNRTNSFEHVGRTGIFDLQGDYCFASYLIRLSVADGKADRFFVNAFMNSDSFQQGIKQFASRAIGQANINAKSLAAYPIPLPPLATQQAIVAEIEAEQALVAANRELIARFEQKIQATLARVWGEEEPATPRIR